MENYRIVGTIGKGGMGRVYRATRVVSSHDHHHDHQHLDGDESPPVSSIATVYYALKKVPVTTLKQLNQALKEAQAVSQLHHYRIIKCHEFFIDRNVHHLQSSSSSSSLASTNNFHHHHHQSTSTILEVPPPPTPTPPPTTTTTTTTWSLLKLTKLGLSHHHNNNNNNNNNNSSLTSPSSLISSNHKNSNKRNSHGNNNSSNSNSILENLNLHLPNRSSSSSSSNNQNHRKTSLRRHKSETGMSRSLDSQTNHSQLMNHILNHNNNNTNNDDFEYHHHNHHQLNDFDHHQNYDNEYMNGSNMNGNGSECPLPMNETWSLCLVLEYCSHGTLKNMIERQKLLNQNMNNNNNSQNNHSQNKKQVMMITEELFWRWMQQICEGLAFMHNSGDGQDDHFYHQEYENSYHGGGTGSENQLKKKKIIHRDVKPENIFLSDEWLNIKIGDLGMARILDLNHSTHASSMAGTMCFMAPEMKTIFSPNPVKSSTAAAERPMKRSYDEKIDIWGVGCVACELTSLIRCDYSYVMSHPKEQQKMVDAIRCMKFSDRVIDWILVTLQHDPRDRPTASQLLQDFFHVSPMRRTLSSSPPPLLGTHLSPSSSSSLSQLLLSPTLSSPTSPSSILLNVNGGVGGVGAIGGSGGMVSFADPRSRNRSESDGGDCDDYRRRTLVSRRIPDEIYILIFSYFTEVEVAICSQVCTRWFNLFNSNKGILWKILFENVWKMDLTQAIQDSIERDFGSLREGFTVRSKLERNWHVGKYKYASFLLHGGSSINGIHFFMGHRISQHYLKHIYRHHKQRRKNLIDKGNRSVSKAKPFVDHFKYDDDYGMHSLTITAGEDGTMKAFDIYGIGLSDDRPLKKELICTFSGHQKGVSCLDFNLQFDKRVLVSGSADKCIIFWDVLSGEPINRITCASEIWDLQILNGTTMGSAGQSCVDLWDLTSNTKLKSYNNCHQGAVYAITHDKRAFHEQCFATGGFDGAVRIWDMRIDSSNGAVMSYIDMQSSINEVQFFGNNLVTGNGGGIVDVFDIRFLDQSKKQYSLNLSSSGAIRGLQFDGLKIVSGSSSGAIKLMDAQSGKFINHMMHNALQEFKSSQMTSIDCNQNVLMTSSMGGQVSVFDFTNFVDTTTEDDMTDSIVSRPSDRSCSLQ